MGKFPVMKEPARAFSWEGPDRAREQEVYLLFFVWGKFASLPD